MEEKIVLVNSNYAFIDALYTIARFCSDNRARAINISIYLMECVTMVKVLWEKWLAFGEWLGTHMGNGILTVFYFTVFVIPGICLSLIFDKIGKKFQQDSYFSQDVRDISLNSIEEAQDE